VVRRALLRYDAATVRVGKRATARFFCDARQRVGCRAAAAPAPVLRRAL